MIDLNTALGRRNVGKPGKVVSYKNTRIGVHVNRALTINTYLLTPIGEVINMDNKHLENNI